VGGGHSTTSAWTWYPPSYSPLGDPGLVTVQTPLMAVRAFVVYLSEHSPESLVLVWLARQRVDELSEDIAAFRPPLECLARDRLSIFLVSGQPAAEHLTVIRLQASERYTNPDILIWFRSEVANHGFGPRVDP
jgi:hypothetical protein